jgi:hypothetical protein
VEALKQLCNYGAVASTEEIADQPVNTFLNFGANAFQPVNTFFLILAPMHFNR